MGVFIGKWCWDEYKKTTSTLDNYAEKLNQFLEKYYPLPSENEYLYPSKIELLNLIKNKDFNQVYSLINDLFENKRVSNNKCNCYAIYYYGIACFSLYKENYDVSLLKKAELAFNTVFIINPKHNLALSYLDKVRDEIKLKE